MSDDFNELYDMLSTERDDIKRVLNEGYQNLNSLIADVRNYHFKDIDIQDEFNLSTEKEKFKIENILVQHKLNKDIINYKISLLQNYLEDLFTEKKFNEFIRDKEENMTSEEYLEYITNPVLQNKTNEEWFKEFIEN